MVHSHKVLDEYSALTGKYLKSAQDKKNKELIKRVFTRLYPLFIVFKKTNSKTLKLPYLKETRSDAMAIVNAGYANNQRYVYILLRCILEDVARVVFYYQHPEEYSWLSEYPKLSLKYCRTPYLVKVYLKRAPKIKDIMVKLNYGAKLTEMYGNYSNYVHATSEKYFSDSSYIETKNPTTKQINKCVDDVSLTVNIVIAILLSYFADNMELNGIEREMVLRYMPKNLKQYIRREMGF